MIMMFFNGFLASPFILVAWLIDMYLLITVFRLLLSRVHAAEPTAAFQAMRTVTDPIPDSVGRWLARRRGRPTPSWLPWLLVILAALLLRHLVLLFIVLAF